jgi:hypothetical protein
MRTVGSGEAKAARGKPHGPGYWRPEGPAAERSMRISRRRLILGQESLVPEWGLPLLAVLGVCLLVLIVLSPIAVVRNQRARTSARAKAASIGLEGRQALGCVGSGARS